MNINIAVDVDSIKKLDDYINLISKYNLSVGNKDFQKYLQNKFLETVKKISDERIGETTNSEFIEEYKSRHKIIETDDGFILYNDTVLPTSMLAISPENASNYPDGFSIALAFEYGTGLIGQENPKLGAWQYNVKGHEKGWVFSRYGQFTFTRGYAGFEIYRYTAEEIRNNLKQWILDYIPKSGGIK